MWSVGKKTALLQAEALACVLGLANVLFCALTVSVFLSFCSKITAVVGFYSLVSNGFAVKSRFNGIYRVLGKVVLCVYLFFKLFNNQIKFVTKYQFCIIVCLIFKEFKEFFFSKTIYKFFHKQSG